MGSMSLFTLANWPLLFVCLAMVVAAVIDGWKLKVPNWLTFPLIISGWLVGLLENFGVVSSFVAPDGAPYEGGIGAAPTLDRHICPRRFYYVWGICGLCVRASPRR